MALTPSPVEDDLHSGRALALIRLTLGVMFIWVFFENHAKGAYTPAGYAGVINYYLGKGAAPAAWKAVMAVMAANAAIAGPMQAATEISFGVLLTLGAATRLVALGAAAFLASLWLSEWRAAWIWELLVPALAALAVAYGRAGRVWGIDAALARRFPRVPLW